MTRSRCLPVVLIPLLLAAPGLAAEPEGKGDAAEERKLALQFMQVTGVPSQGSRVAWSLMGQLVEAYPDVPEEEWVRLHGEMTGELVELAIPIYTRNFSQQELRELIEFYGSPLGLKLMERTPSIMQESNQAFSGWAATELGEMVKTLEEKGYKRREAPGSGPDPAPPGAPAPPVVVPAP